MGKLHQQALQRIQNDEWDTAHRLIQDCSDPLSCQIHAYIHRTEGDLANAKYWYQQAGVAMPEVSLTEEFKSLMATVLPK